MKTIHPAIAEHVMEENERLREVLRCIADLPMDRCITENDYRLSAAKAIALGALSQQAEPCDWCAGAGHDFYGDKCIYCKSEPAPAQDEREAVERFSPTTSVPHCGRASEVEAYMTEDDDGEYMTVAQHERIVASLTRPAQTEQQLVRLPERKRTDHLPKEYKTMTVVRAGIEAYNRALDDVAALNAAPIEQTAPQPEQSVLAEALEQYANDSNWCYDTCNVSRDVAKRALAAYRAAQGVQHE